MLPSQSVRTLMLFFMVAVMLNLLNYIIYAYHMMPKQISAVRKKLDVASRQAEIFYNGLDLPSGGPWNDILKTDKMICDDKTTPQNSEPYVEKLEKQKGNTKEKRIITTQTTEDNSDVSYKTLPDILNISGAEVPICPEEPSNLGPIEEDSSFQGLAFIQAMQQEVLEGGIYKPVRCRARNHVAIIVPFIRRGVMDARLGQFLFWIHAFLIKQQLDYRLFIVEQSAITSLNYLSLSPGKLMNIGFREAEKLRPGGWSCYIFHGIDVIPLDTRNLYKCGDHPTELFGFLQTLNKSEEANVKLQNGFSKVLALTKSQFKKANGFSNIFWSQNGEYEDIIKRIKYRNETVLKSVEEYARYTILSQNNKNLNYFTKDYPPYKYNVPLEAYDNNFNFENPVDGSPEPQMEPTLFTSLEIMI